MGSWQLTGSAREHTTRHVNTIKSHLEGSCIFLHLRIGFVDLSSGRFSDGYFSPCYSMLHARYMVEWQGIIYGWPTNYTSSWNGSCHFSAGGGRLGEGLGLKLQDQHTCDHCDCSDYLHGFHPLSEDYVCQDCCGSRFSHTDNAGTAGFNVAEGFDIEGICGKGRTQCQCNNEHPRPAGQAPKLTEARHGDNGQEQATENQGVQHCSG